MTMVQPTMGPLPVSVDFFEPDPWLPENCTTAMLKNIPNKYMRDRLIQKLNEDGFRGDIDFVYVPIDFRNKCNVGYAFINFRTSEACSRFAARFHNVDSHEKLPGFNSKKVLEVAPARVQGLELNVQRLQNSPVMHQIFGQPEADAWLPVLLDETGASLEFPVPPGCRPNEYPKPARGFRGPLPRRGRGQASSAA